MKNEENNAGKLIDALHAAGATLVVEDGKTRVRGAKVPDELLAQLKANKDAVLAEWQRRQDLNRDRFGCVPANDAPLLALDLMPVIRTREAVVQYCWRQPRPLHAWIMGRANEYHQQGIPAEDCDWRACVDALAWQRNTTDARKALDWLEGIEEAARMEDGKLKMEKTKEANAEAK